MFWYFPGGIVAGHRNHFALDIPLFPILQNIYGGKPTRRAHDTAARMRPSLAQVKVLQVIALVALEICSRERK